MCVMNHNFQLGNSVSSAECSRDRPPFSFVRGQDSTMWDIVWVSPQEHMSVSASLHFLDDVNAVVRQYCCNTETEDRVRVYQFMRDITACRNWYNRGCRCILSRNKICDINFYQLLDLDACAFARMFWFKFLFFIFFYSMCFLCTLCVRFHDFIVNI